MCVVRLEHRHALSEAAGTVVHRLASTGRQWFVVPGARIQPCAEVLGELGFPVRVVPVADNTSREGFIVGFLGCFLVGLVRGFLVTLCWVEIP